MNVIHKFEKLVLALVLGLIAPVIGLMGFWGGAYYRLAERMIPYAALGGLLLGLLVDLFVLRSALRRAHQLDLKLWMAIYLFYSAGVFGLFMGVPVPNAFLALPAGFIIGGRLAWEAADGARVRAMAQRTAWFTTGVLALICIASAFIALMSPSTAYDLKGMLGLGFEVTGGMIVALILVGGAALLAFGWALTLISVRFSYTFLQRKE
jgi:hypothetical protein